MSLSSLTWLSTDGILYTPLSSGAQVLLFADTAWCNSFVNTLPELQEAKNLLIF